MAEQELQDFFSTLYYRPETLLAVWKFEIQMTKVLFPSR